MKKDNIKERVIAVLKYKGLNVNRASSIFAMPQRTLNRQVNEDGKVAMELVYAILDNFPEISPAWLIMGEGDMLREESVVMECESAPFYSDMPVSAGLREAFDPSREKASGYISLPSQNASFYFPVFGTSMEPEVFAGDIVGVVRVEPDDKITPDAIYMIVTNDARMIKHCYIDENNHELLWCVSPNYPSFPINKSDICAMFRVVSRIQYF